MKRIPLAGVLALAPSVSFAQEIPDRATLDALLGSNQTLEDFESYPVPPNDSVGLLDVKVLDSTTVANGHGPGLVEPGAKYYVPGSNVHQWNGDGWQDVTTKSYYVNFTHGHLVIEYSPPVQAFGIDLANITGGYDYDGEAEVHDASGNLVGLPSFFVGGDPGDRDFVGWRHDAGIAQVVLHSFQTFWSPVVDDHGYGDLDTRIGTSYCQPLPNSTGATGEIAAYGSEAAADDDVSIVASDLPLSEVGYVLNSASQASIPVGSGILCVGSPIGRHAKQVGDSGLGGTIATKLDLGALPRPGGAHAVQPGETWYFTLWHRDGATSNFTDGVGITFQ